MALLGLARRVFTLGSAKYCCRNFSNQQEHHGIISSKYLLQNNPGLAFSGVSLIVKDGGILSKEMTPCDLQPQLGQSLLWTPFSHQINPVQKPSIGIPITYKINPIIYKKERKPMEDPVTSRKIIEEAPDVVRIEKHAARLIVIRRIKMNRHKLKKLRKKMRFEWGKRKLRREIKKERIFLDSKIAQIREAERFDAKEFVANAIAKAKHVEIPRRWKRKRMPAWWIKEQLALGKIKIRGFE